MSQLPKLKKLAPLKKPNQSLAKPAEKTSPKPVEKPVAKTSPKPVAKTSPKPVAKTSPKPVAKTSPKPVAKSVSEKDWRDSLRKYLRNELLPRAIESETALDQLVSPENMETWATAFTSEDYNPNPGENWEELELLGDRLLSYLFTKYMMESYPGANRGQISVLITVYLAKPFLAQLSGKLGINRHIRSRFNNTIHMMEDVFESTFGALVKAGDTIKNGVGVGLAYNLFVSIFEEVEIDWKLARGNPKTQVKEVFETMFWINPKEQEKVPDNFYDNDGQVVFQVLLNDNAIKQLREMGIKPTSKILGQGQGFTKKVASDAAYIQALDTLEKMGLTYDWIKQVRTQRELENPELAEYYTKLEAKLKSEGLVDFAFREDRVKTNIGDKASGVYVQLIGIDAAGNKRILSMTENPVESSLIGKQQVLAEWTE